jgi:hypothetical protein
MLQDKLLQPGKFIVVRPLPHTPAVGVAQIVKIQHGVVHFVYKRSDESRSQDLTLARSDCEYLITHGMWTDGEEVSDRPSIPQQQGEAVEGYVIEGLDPSTSALTDLLGKYSTESIKAHFDRGARLFWERVVMDARA